MIHRALLMRHSIPEKNVPADNGTYIKDPDPYLSRNGVALASIKGLAIEQYAATEGLELRVASSPLNRAYDTARCAFPDTEIEVIPDLTEVQHNIHRGTVSSTLAGIALSPWTGTNARNWGGESPQQAAQRTLTAISDKVKSNDPGVLQVFVGHSFNIAGVRQEYGRSRASRLLVPMMGWGATSLMRLAYSAQTMKHCQTAGFIYDPSVDEFQFVEVSDEI